MTKEIFGYHFRSIMEQFEGKVRSSLKEVGGMVAAYLWLTDSVDALVAVAGWSRVDFDHWTQWDKEQQLYRETGGSVE